MNNEPVAWMETYKGEPNNLDWDKSNLNYGSEFHDVVPLYTHPVNPYQSITNTKIEPTVVSYTHPVKELPNNHQYIAQLEMTVRNQQAEIDALKANPVKKLTDNEIVWLWCDCEKDGTEATYIKFARAILRKAQEK